MQSGHLQTCRRSAELLREEAARLEGRPSTGWRGGSFLFYVSPGHLIDIPTAKRIIPRCGRGYRLPEPIRLAHMMVSRYCRHQEK
jgi:hypothetical protein